MDFSGRNIMSIQDFSRDELEHIFKVASNMEKFVKTGSDMLKNKILANLFFEPSTRTRLSFVSAMYRLGGKVLGFDDPKMSSKAKGETLVDTIRVIESYADAIVIRHTIEGSVTLAAEYSSVPIINAGSVGQPRDMDHRASCAIFDSDNNEVTIKRLKYDIKAVQEKMRGSKLHSFLVERLSFGR